jgi:NADPH:quinone reductase-like Zn-dependent oxidoreductase
MWSSCLPALVSRDWHNFYEYTGILTLVLGVVAMVFTSDAARYDVIIDCVGNAPYKQVRHLLKPGSALLLVVADFQSLMQAPLLSRRTGNLVTASAGKPTAEDLAYLVHLAEAGHYRAVRDRTYDLTDIAAAHQYVDTGHKRGAVVVRITSSEPEPTPFTQQKELSS